MNADQLAGMLRTLISQITGWLKLLAGLLLALMVFATLTTMLGHPIPYVPAFRGSLQEAGIWTACLAYFLSR